MLMSKSDGTRCSEVEKTTSKSTLLTPATLSADNKWGERRASERGNGFFRVLLSPIPQFVCYSSCVMCDRVVVFCTPASVTSSSKGSRHAELIVWWKSDEILNNK